MESLAGRGVHVLPCVGAPGELKALADAGFLCVPLAESGGKPGKSRLFAVVSDHPLDAIQFPAAKFPPDRPLASLEAEAAEWRGRLAGAESILSRLKGALPSMDESIRRAKGEAETAAVRESVLSDGRLAGIEGYIPEESLPALLEVSGQNRWGLVSSKPGPEDAVPTLLKKPRWSKLLDPMVQFLNLSPGYREIDVSVPVMIFLTLFFGILIADVVYGVLFVAAAGVLYWRLGRRNVPVGLMSGLLGLFGLSSVLWGALTGNYGGYEPHGYGLPYLCEGPDKESHMKLVCFTLGAVHLSVGHLMKLFSKFTVRHLVAHAGWIMILFGNLILVSNLLMLVAGPMPAWLPWYYAAALLMVVAGEIDFGNFSSMLSCPLEVINSFSDLLSYIRLFAVCLAGFYLAKVFNGIAFGMMDSVIGVFSGSVLLLMGHVMNIALGGLAILVHGVRLNTLEFSSHAQVRWNGFPYAPFREPPAPVAVMAPRPR